jgi:hypothetical protein
MDGIIEDGDEDKSAASKSMPRGETAKRWTWIMRCAVGIGQIVDGFKPGET